MSPPLAAPVGLALALALGCTPRPPPSAAPARPSPPPDAPVLGIEVLARHPHDVRAFTQGLEFHRGLLLESTGLPGHSSLRLVEPETGRVTQRVEVAAPHFAEGATVFRDRVYQLTYVSRRCFVYDATTLARVGEHTYEGEGWGLTHDATRLIMSDGTSALRFIEPDTFRELGRVTVTDRGAPVDQLNELEYVDGAVYANVWHTDRIARIDPATGRVTAWIDLRALREALRLDEPEAVLNGIALHPETGRLWVTGKLWPTVFEVRVTSGRGAAGETRPPGP